MHILVLQFLPQLWIFKLSQTNNAVNVSHARDISYHYAFQVCACIGWSQNVYQFRNHRLRSLKVRAIENSHDGQAPIVPIQFESPTGQLLLQIMQTHPHLLPSTIDQQLENLQTDRDAEKEKPPPASQDNPLFRLNTHIFISSNSISEDNDHLCCQASVINFFFFIQDEYPWSHANFSVGEQLILRQSW